MLFKSLWQDLNLCPYAYKAGIKAFVVQDKKIRYSKYPNAEFLLVDNTLDALQQLAQHHRKTLNIPFIAITGSNGKTILKEWLYYLMNNHCKIGKSPGSYNSQIGVPLSVLRIEKADQLAIIESGISISGEMAKL